ncbi:hypothetical protein GGE66_000279 [Rhizobium leguminosarum]|uniref:Epoxide hydrolase N-terminal domain-containing protein n=1 Tax=Rhizobium leguminosarum TaxID=384 RepID=A0A7W9ZMD9_RHILE|nr:hypothetical protein [Rhizobium leguminosarum]
MTDLEKTRRSVASSILPTPTRRQLLAATAAAGVISLLPRMLRAAVPSDTIRPFRADIPDEQLADLRRRILAARWPDKETVADQSQGVPLATMRDLAIGRQTTTGARERRS